MIRFGIPHIKEDGETALLINSVDIDGKKDDIWFKVDKKFKQYLCDERDDAYLVASLNYAMRNGHDIVCEAPITAKLLFKIQNYLIPALKEANPQFHAPTITAPIADNPLPNAGAVGTGISCGVDSLHALADKTGMPFEKLNITHLTFNNVGSHGEGERARKLYQSRIERPKQFAEEFGFEFVWSDSNLMDVIEQNHFKTHTYSSMFPVLCLQKLFSTYYYASGGYLFNEFELRDFPMLCCGSYELLSLPVFSTEGLSIFSEGMGKSRINKLKKVSQYSPSYRYLNVCLDEGDNCGHCEKCVRTMLGLDAIGALDKYSAVFNVEHYRRNKKWYLKQLAIYAATGKHDYLEMMPYFRKELTLPIRIQAYPHKYKRRIANLLRRYPNLFKIAKKVSKSI